MFRRLSLLVGRATDHDYAASVTIGIGALGGLAWSSFSTSSYQRAMAAWPMSRGVLGIASWRDFVGTGLMTLFFFAVGLELARERHHGSLRNLRHSLAPVLGAFTGMAGPALIVVAAGLITRTPTLVHGWGIPMATDIAFTLAVLAVAGSRVPASLRTFLLTLAITDDVASIVVLAATGATRVNFGWLALSGALVGAIITISRWHHSTPWRLCVVALVWWALARAGVEPPLAGVIAGVIVPFDAHRSLRLERAMTRLSVAVVLPLFALAYCGVSWSNLASATPLTIIVAIVLARLLGKAVGISVGVATARRLGARLAPGISGISLTAAGVLCAIGVTVPLLFAGRLYDPQSATYGAFDVGLVAASILAALVGVVLLRTATRHQPEGDS